MSQSKQILAYLKKGYSLSALEALQKFGCFRLAARIYELRNSGYRIEAERVGEGATTWAEYRLNG
tara:strand:+ start:2730 stop:2924 length:195 start_codon:yes stop_codon:yes gene_type:complete